MTTSNTISNTRRFFVPPDILAGNAGNTEGDTTITLTDPDLVHQLSRVLRLQAGDTILLLDGQGEAYEVCLRDVGRNRVVGHIQQRTTAGGELPWAVTLSIALLRPERFEWVVQKGTELGVHTFVPVCTERSLAADRAGERKLARWRKIAQEAAEQSCRARVPHICEPLPFAEACAQAADTPLRLLLWEGTAPPLRQVVRPALSPNDSNSVATTTTTPASLALFSGPEGGFSTAELTTATEHGIIPVSLGPRILRAETAPIAALAAIVYEQEG